MESCSSLFLTHLPLVPPGGHYVPSCAGFGPYSEAAFYHVSSRTLLVTDAVIQVPSQPPEVSQGAFHDVHCILPGLHLAHAKPFIPGDT